MSAREWKDGDRSWQLRYAFKDIDGQYKSFEEEFDAEATALERVGAILRGSTVKQVSVVKWRHEHNLPFCSPAIVAKSLAMTVYELVDDTVAEKPIDIHARSY